MPPVLGISFQYLLFAVFLGPFLGGVLAGLGIVHWAGVMGAVVGWIPVVFLILRKRASCPQGVMRFAPERLSIHYVLLASIAAPMAVGTFTLICTEFRVLSEFAPPIARLLFSTPILVPLGQSGSELAVRVLVVVAVLPICEELFFRGVLLHRLATRINPRAALLISSTLFAFTHTEWLGHFLYGIVWGGMALYTRRLFWSVSSHMLLNAIAVAGSFVLKETVMFTDFQFFLTGCRSNDVVGAICIALSVGTAIFLMRNLSPAREGNAPLKSSPPPPR